MTWTPFSGRSFAYRQPPQFTEWKLPRSLNGDAKKARNAGGLLLDMVVCPTIYRCGEPLPGIKKTEHLSSAGVAPSLPIRWAMDLASPVAHCWIARCTA